MPSPISSEPLSEEELNFLEEILEKYRSDASVLNVSELDGLFTAVVSGPQVVRFDDWYSLIWGGPEYLPEWKDEQEFERFFTLIIQHMNDIATHLLERPDEFEPLFSEINVEGEIFLIVEDWCLGYMRGMVAGEGWPELPEQEQRYLSAITMHTEEDDLLDGDDNPLQIEALDAMDCIVLAAVQLHHYWISRQVIRMPMTAESKVGRNDPCPCGSGKKFKQCCLH